MTLKNLTWKQFKRITGSEAHRCRRLSQKRQGTVHIISDRVPFAKFTNPGAQLVSGYFRLQVQADSPILKSIRLHDLRCLTYVEAYL